jgi:hypothetical protein
LPKDAPHSGPVSSAEPRPEPGTIDGAEDRRRDVVPANGVVEAAAPAPKGGSAERLERTVVQPKLQTRSPLHSARKHVVLARPAAPLLHSERRGSRATLQCRGWQ